MHQQRWLTDPSQAFFVCFFKLRSCSGMPTKTQCPEKSQHLDSEALLCIIIKASWVGPFKAFQNKHNIPVAEHDSLSKHKIAITENRFPQTGFGTQVSLPQVWLNFNFLLLCQKNLCCTSFLLPIYEL